jgi:CDP-glucose 4,6-dehydratase
MMTLPDPEFWRGRRVLVTGHTGFKGAWLALWLTQMGARVTGYALPPQHGDGIFGAANLIPRITSVTADIRNRLVFRRCVELMRPQIVFHLAAHTSPADQTDPIETYDVNALGTAKMLEELRRFPFVQAVVVVTSDRIYEVRNNERPFREGDQLGGGDPHGAGSAAAEFIVQTFRHSLGEHSAVAVATARAGNVIGGGDWTHGRLVPDAIRAFVEGDPLIVHDPEAALPCQYVLDPLCGYLLLAEQLMDNAAHNPAIWRSAWNFGPEDPSDVSVRDVADRLAEYWNTHDLPAYTPMASWRSDDTEDGPHGGYGGVRVDSSKARHTLNWQPRLSLEKALAVTVDWYKAQQRGENMAMHSALAIDDYLEA